MSTLLFGEASYRNVVCLGHILDRDGQKMSKSKGNVVEPWQVLDRQGADAFRWYLFTVSSPWYPRRFFPEAIDEVVRKFLLTLWNTYSFFVVYANIDGFEPAARTVPVAERPLLDRWIIAYLNRVVDQVRAGLDDYEVTGSGRAIQEFVDGLSNWYVRRSRRRFWKSQSDADKLSAYLTLHECLVTVAKLLAPYTPFIAEEIYRNLALSPGGAGPESVHLCDYPVADTSLIDEQLLYRMEQVRRVVNAGRAARNKAGVKTRQPLSTAIVVAPAHEQQALAQLEHLVTEELNVKHITYAADAADLLQVRLKPNLQKLGPRFGAKRSQVDAAIAALDPAHTLSRLESDGQVGILVDGREEALTRGEILVEESGREGYAIEQSGGRIVAIGTDISSELRREGLVRELVHRIQGLRKDSGFRIEDRIVVSIAGAGELVEAVREYADFFRVETLCDRLTFASGAAAPGAPVHALKVEGDEVAVSVARMGSISQE